MFWAIDEKGNVVNAKDYQGQRIYSPHNGEEMIYVHEHKRVWLNQKVRPHFRFKKGAKPHAMRDFHPLKYDVLEFFVEKLKDTHEWSNNKPYLINGLEYAVDLYLKDYNGQEFVIDVNVDSIPAKETQNKIQYFSNNEIAYLVVLSAVGDNNPDGKFFRDGYLEDTKIIAGNELGLLRNYSICNYYFNHDRNAILKVLWSNDRIEKIEKEEYKKRQDGRVYKPERILYVPLIKEVFDKNTDFEIVLVRTKLLDKNFNIIDAPHLKGGIRNKNKKELKEKIVIPEKIRKGAFKQLSLFDLKKEPYKK